MNLVRSMYCAGWSDLHSVQTPMYVPGSIFSFSSGMCLYPFLFLGLARFFLPTPVLTVLVPFLDFFHLGGGLGPVEL